MAVTSLAVTSPAPAVASSDVKNKKELLELPKNAYGCFFEKNREDLTAACEGLPTSSVMMFAGKRWAQMSELEKQPYEDEFEQRKQAFEDARMKAAFTSARRAAKRHEDRENGVKRKSPGAKLKEYKLVPPSDVCLAYGWGTQVFLEGLVGAAELNGQCGVISGFDSSASRYLIQLKEGKDLKRVKPSNIRVLFKTGDNVVIQGAGELDCQHARVEGFDAKSLQHVVRIVGGGATPQRINPQQLCGWIQPGAEVILHDLQRAPELNGKVAVVKGFDEINCRYLLYIPGSDTDDYKRLRPGNVWLKLPDGTKAVHDDKQVEIMSFDKHTAQYLLKQQSGGDSSQCDAAEEQQSPKAKPNKAWLATKFEVVIGGLQRVPELNGQLANIHSFDEKEERYVVRLSYLESAAVPDALRRLQPKNLAPWFPPDSEVLLMGQSKKLDGERACVKQFLAMRRSYLVVMEQTGTMKQMRPENLCLSHRNGSRVILHGFPMHPEMDGHLALVEAFSSRDRRYLVKLIRTSKTKLVKPEHLARLLEPGAAVRIDGLEKAPDLNGSLGKVVRFDDQHGRYVVRLIDTIVQELKRIRPENVFSRPCDEEDSLVPETLDQANAPDALVNGADPLPLPSSAPLPSLEQLQGQLKLLKSLGKSDNKEGEEDDGNETDKDSLNEAEAGEAMQFSSSSSSDDGFGHNSHKRRRIDNKSTATAMPRSIIKALAAKASQEAERRVLKEESKLADAAGNQE